MTTPAYPAGDRDLPTLLTRARNAAPGDRIRLRDLIAAHGEPAAVQMRTWVADARLGPFAVRVLEAGPDHAAATTALRGARRTAATETIRGDIDAALLRLKRAGALADPNV